MPLLTETAQYFAGGVACAGLFEVGRAVVWPWAVRRRAMQLQRQRIRDLESSRQLSEGLGGPSIPKLRLPNHGNPADGVYAYVGALNASGLRCFESAVVEFRYPGEPRTRALSIPNVTLLVGNNGSGKSTILKAITLAALGPILDSSGFVPYRLVRERSRRAQIAARFIVTGGNGPVAITSQTRVDRRGDLEQLEADNPEPLWEDLYSESSPSLLLVAYGVDRKVANDARHGISLERGRRRRRYSRVASLFDESVSLVPYSAWVPQLTDGRRREIAALLAELLPDGLDFTHRFEGDEALFRRDGLDIPLKALSDGFRSYVGWLGDLLFHLVAVAPIGVPIAQIGGMVVVDEVDLLLHPSWQRVVVPSIARAMPNMQFVFTTHSPIVAGTLEPENILLCRRDETTGDYVVGPVNANVHGLAAEQVLLSSYFGLSTTRSPDAQLGLDRLLEAAVDGDETAAREYMSRLASGMRSAAETDD